MSENDPKLVVQLVEQMARLRWDIRHCDASIPQISTGNHACLTEPAASAETDLAEAAASRHSVSAKIRIEPPAVRTYSTLPAAIQL